MDAFGLTFDFSLLNYVLSLPTADMIYVVLAMGGWTAVALIFFFMGSELWVDIAQGVHTKTWKWVLLAIDIPLEEIQGPKAVEQIFAHFSGALAKPSVYEKYWLGKKQKWFSLEIIGIEGYIQFLIYTEEHYRDLVEAAIYAQYPAAQITEVEDYIGNIPDAYPNENYDMDGREYILKQPDPYPIRTYEEFEHTVTKDFMFNDPMAALLENFTRLGAGENLWFQIVIEPVEDDWKEKGIKLVKSIIEQKKSQSGSNVFAKFVDFVGEFVISAFSAPAEGAKKEQKKDDVKKMSDLTPGMRDTVAAIEDKISKIGFKTKLRLIYAARKEVFRPSKCMDGFTGAVNQFNYIGRNQFAWRGPYADAPFKMYKMMEKKRRLVSAYKKRSLKKGKNPYILNIEELATIWHFPLPIVKTPLLQKTPVKRAEPPTNLPMETLEPLLRPVTAKKFSPPPAPEEEKQESFPEELPYG